MLIGVFGYDYINLNFAKYLLFPGLNRVQNTVWNEHIVSDMSKVTLPRFVHSVIRKKWPNKLLTLDCVLSIYLYAQVRIYGEEKDSCQAIA